MEPGFFQGSLAVELLIQLNIYGSLLVKEGKPSGCGLRRLLQQSPPPTPRPSLVRHRGRLGYRLQTHRTTQFFSIF